MPRKYHPDFEKDFHDLYSNCSLKAKDLDAMLRLHNDDEIPLRTAFLILCREIKNLKSKNKRDD